MKKHGKKVLKKYKIQTEENQKKQKKERFSFKSLAGLPIPCTLWLKTSVH